MCAGANAGVVEVKCEGEGVKAEAAGLLSLPQDALGAVLARAGARAAAALACASAAARARVDDEAVWRALAVGVAQGADANACGRCVGAAADAARSPRDWGLVRWKTLCQVLHAAAPLVGSWREAGPTQAGPGDTDAHASSAGDVERLSLDVAWRHGGALVYETLRVGHAFRRRVLGVVVASEELVVADARQRTDAHCGPALSFCSAENAHDVYEPDETGLLFDIECIEGCRDDDMPARASACLSCDAGGGDACSSSAFFSGCGSEALCSGSGRWALRARVCAGFGLARVGAKALVVVEPEVRGIAAGLEGLSLRRRRSGSSGDCIASAASVSPSFERSLSAFMGASSSPGSGSARSARRRERRRKEGTAEEGSVARGWKNGVRAGDVFLLRAASSTRPHTPYF